MHPEITNTPDWCGWSQTQRPGSALQPNQIWRMSVLTTAAERLWDLKMGELSGRSLGHEALPPGRIVSQEIKLL